MALIALTLLSMARLYVGAQSSQANIALAMRQVSEVAWRVKDLEMWTRLSVSEAGTDGGSPDRAAAFALSNAKALLNLRYIESVLDGDSIAALARLSSTLEQLQSGGDVSIGAAAEAQTRRDLSGLVKEAGNLNFEAVADVLVSNKRALAQQFLLSGIVSAISAVLVFILLRDRLALVRERQEADRTHLESLGALCSGFAHVTQNILWSLRESLNEVARIGTLTEDDQTKVRRALEDMQGLTELNASLTAAAQDPSRDDVERPLSDVVDAVLARAEAAGRVPGVDLDWHSEEMPVPFATTTFVLSELISNATDAVSAAPVPEVRLKVAEDRSGLRLSVTDNGAGMPPAVRRSCLQPFFSTKQDSAGHCGMGLHAVSRLVTNLGGRLDIDTVENQGTTVHVRLPKSVA